MTLYLQFAHYKSVQVMKQVVKRQFTQCTQYLRMRKQAVLLVDAGNAFNSVNRQVFLHNICIISPPPIATYVRNCYTLPSRLFIIGETKIPSSEGTTQGDPTAISIYAIAITPLVLMIMEIMSTSPDNTRKMVACPDDITAGCTVKDLKYWWETL